MKIVVLGTGYVWLIQATGLAKMGFSVTAIDVVPEKIALLQKGIPTIYEDGLDALLQESRANIDFTLDLEAVRGVDVIFLCVPTPQDSSGATDLSFIRTACESIKPLLTGSEIIVIKSTIPVWTNAMVYTLLWERNPVVSNPEFLREWVAIYDFFHPTRVILWFRDHETPTVKEQVRSVYAYFEQKDIPILEMNWNTAELTKYAANAFLATKITFMNELARLADASGADMRQIGKALGLDPRIGSRHLSPGIGYGWSCFPKDVKSLIHQFQSYGLRGEIVEQVDAINLTQPRYFLTKILSHYHQRLQGKIFAFSGLTFKPDTDDLRESRSLDLMRLLLEQWAHLRVFDYNQKAREHFKKYQTQFLSTSPVVLCDTFDTMLVDTDALIVTVEDPRIQDENLVWVGISDRVIFDGRNILQKELLESKWFTYYGIGC